MAAKAQAEVQALLGFLTREAKVPLAEALPKYNLMRAHGLVTPDAIAKSDAVILKSIFSDEKTFKQVQAAAKRLSNPKKRSANNSMPPATKQLKSAVDKESELELPQTTLSADELRSKTIETNRAPLFLAFAFVLSKYTLPDQPVSSRLSLAQAVTSAGAQSKAKYIGLTDSTAEDEGWAQGQPKVKLMGREIAVMRRHIPAPVLVKSEMVGDWVQIKPEDIDDKKTLEADNTNSSHEAFWGMDLEALRKSNGPLVAGKGSAGPPVHKPESARAYLLRSIDVVDPEKESEHKVPAKTEESSSPVKNKKLTAAERTARKEQAVAMVLKSIDLVCASWASTLTNDELDRRASSWYANVRPEVEGGQAGWGQRGRVPLETIIDLAKDS